jgi:UDP-N-acetylglucosamine diphosphorylase/glucosamine-1-phosphate N-acetyltransferase
MIEYKNNIYKNNNSAIIIMAGGLGKRMNSELPKVLHLINKKPMIVHVIERAIELNVYKIIIVVGKFYNIIKSTIQDYINSEFYETKIFYVMQQEPLGTGNAIVCCKNILNKLPIYVTTLCILSGDVPLIKSKTINNLLLGTNTCKILISKIEDPSGYGRIVVENNNIIKIIEDKDCNSEEKKIQFINSGIYSFNISILLKYIEKIDNINANNEYYLTQIFEIIKKDNYNIGYNYTDNLQEISGVNNKDQLNELEKLII